MCRLLLSIKLKLKPMSIPKYEFGGSAPMKDDGDDSDEEYERHHNIVGDVEAEVRHQDMDHYLSACLCG